MPPTVHCCGCWSLRASLPRGAAPAERDEAWNFNDSSVRYRAFRGDHSRLQHHIVSCKLCTYHKIKPKIFFPKSCLLLIYSRNACWVTTTIWALCRVDGHESSNHGAVISLGRASGPGCSGAGSGVRMGTRRTSPAGDSLSQALQPIRCLWERQRGQGKALWHLQGQTHSVGWRAWEVQRGDLSEAAGEAAWGPGTPWRTPALRGRTGHSCMCIGWLRLIRGRRSWEKWARGATDRDTNTGPDPWCLQLSAQKV